MADFKIDLAAYLDLMLHKGVQGGKYGSFNGIFHRHHAKACPAPFHLGEDGLDCLDGLIVSGMTEIFDTGLVGIGRFGPEIGHNGFFLRQAAGGNYLMKDGAQSLLGEFIFVFLQQPGIYLAFTQGIILSPFIF